jgi:hypothetical protein
MRPYQYLLATLLTCHVGAVAAQTDPVENKGCTVHFSRGDPELFDFVSTREGVDFTRYQGMTIQAMHYAVLPIFNENDPEEDNWLFRTANLLHIETQPDTVDRQMILASGTELDVKRLKENERLLRANEYLVDAMILPHKVCDQSIELLVVVRDVWTLTPSASASRSGGENSSSAGITESNLLGTGHKISLGYFNDADRSGRTFSYTGPDLFRNHTRLQLAYEDNSDGYVRYASLNRPFYQLDSRWSAGAAMDEERLVETIEENEAVVNEYVKISNYYSASAGWSAGRQNGHVNRWWLGVTEDETLYEPTDFEQSRPPEDRRSVYPWLAWESIEDRYWTTSNISHSHRHEDILLGLYTYLRAGYARPQWGSTHRAVIYDASQGYTASFGDHHLLQLSASADGRYDLDADRPESTVYAAGASYYHFPDRKNRWYANLRYKVGRNLRDDELLSSGGSGTLRGYPDDVQRGNRQWVFTAERRRFSDIHLFNLAYLGAAAYVDAGRTWHSDIPASRDNPVLANLGLGLRATPSKFNVDKVLHVDVAVPMVERDRVKDYQIIVAGRVDF